MSQQRRAVGLLAGGAVTFALLAAPVTAIAQDPSAAPASAAPASAAPASAAPAATVSEACQAASLEGSLKNPGRLTLSTDNPAFPPWWGGDPATQYPNEPEGGSGWEVSDPYSGEGFEGAVAYATAAALGFTPDQIDWVPNPEFTLAFQPGPKAFDWHQAQVSIQPERAENVDFSAPYFDSNQSLIAMTGNPIAAATSIAELKDFTLGAAVGTTSLQLIEEAVVPNTEPQVFNDNAAAIQALQNGQIDGLVVDLGTAFFIRDAQLEDYDTPDPESTIVGQFPPSVQVDQVGMVLEKDSPLTACVSEAVEAIRASGELQAVYDQWIATGQDIAALQ
jgi:polar amino acid transport system substrate-binding protein